MTWTKLTKETTTQGEGFLSGDGFMSQGFLSGASGVWVKIDDVEDTWIKIEKETE